MYRHLVDLLESWIAGAIEWQLYELLGANNLKTFYDSDEKVSCADDIDGHQKRHAFHCSTSVNKNPERIETIIPGHLHLCTMLRNNFKISSFVQTKKLFGRESRVAHTHKHTKERSINDLEKNRNKFLIHGLFRRRGKNNIITYACSTRTFCELALIILFSLLEN